MFNPSALLAHLTTSAFRDIAGTHVSARIPVSRGLLNAVIAEALHGTRAPLRSVDVRPKTGDRFEAVVTVSWPFVPALTVTFDIERQPQFPASPILVLRWSFLGAVGSIASRLVASLGRLPNGVRLDGDRLLIDIPALAGREQAAAMLLPFVRTLEVHTLDDRVVADVALEIPR